MCSRSDACPAGTAGTNDVIPSSAPPAPPFSLLFAPPVIAPFRSFSLPVIAPFRAFSLLLTLAIAPFRSFSRPNHIWGKIRGLLPPKKSRMPARDSRPPGGALTAYLRCNFWRTRQSLRENWRREFEAVASGEPRATPPNAQPAPEQRRTTAGFGEGRHFPRVFRGIRG